MSVKTGLTRAQYVALKNISAGRDSWIGLEGRSAFGGHVKTLVALDRRGLIADGKITDAGMKAVIEAVGKS